MPPIIDPKPACAYFNGALVPVENAKISVRTHGFLYGTSIFEGIRAYWLPEQNAVSMFRAREHFDRMVRNARIFFMKPPLTTEEMIAITRELLKRNAAETDTYIRPTLYMSAEQISPCIEDTLPTELTIWSAPLGAYVDISKGLHVCTSSWRRVDDNAIPPRAKASGSYMNASLIVTDARRSGFDDAIVLDQAGSVTEGSAMNLFMLRDGKLITPGRTENILEGITRDTLMTLARQELGIPCEERMVDRTELYVCDELFYSGTGAQVAPITKVDHRPVGTGEIGPITRQLQELYFKVVKAQLPQYAHWCDVVPLGTPVGV